MELTASDLVNIERARVVAEEHGYMLNPDIKRTRKIANLLVKNEEEYGKRYCPCKQSHPVDPGQDVVCPCPDMDDEIARDGHCHCWLFFRKPAAEDKPCED